MAKVVYKNWAAEYGFLGDGLDDAFEADAPAQNMLSEIPGRVAIVAASSQPPKLVFHFGDGSGSSSSLVGRPVGAVAIVNTNAFPSGNIDDMAVCRFIDSDGAYSETPVTYTNGRTDGSTMTNLYWLGSDAEGSANLDDVVTVEVEFTGASFGRRDPWANIVTYDAPFFGPVVAGPVFKPQHGIRLEGYSPGVSDPSQIATSIGGTTWAAQRTRLRRVTAEFACLLTSEIEADAPSLSIRGLVEHCGVSKPALWILNEAEVGRQSMYAYFAEEVNWSGLDKVDDVDDDNVRTLAVGYRLGFSLREAK